MSKIDFESIISLKNFSSIFNWCQIEYIFQVMLRFWMLLTNGDQGWSVLDSKIICPISRILSRASELGRMVTTKWKHWNQIQIFENKMYFKYFSLSTYRRRISKHESEQSYKYIFLVVSKCTICNFEYNFYVCVPMGLIIPDTWCIILLLIIRYIYPYRMYL